MNEEIEKKNNDPETIKWRFWFLISFSLFLIVTFVYYLPLRFEYSVFRDKMPMHKEGDMTQMTQGDRHETMQQKEGLTVNLNVTPVPVYTGTTTRLDFFVNQKPGNIPVPISELEIDHTKFMHINGVRDDLNEFFHIHPESLNTPGILTVDYTFSKPGSYKIWSGIKKGGVNHSFGHPKIMIEGEGEQYKKEVDFSRSATIDEYKVEFHYDDPVNPGKETDLHFDIHDVYGREVRVEPFLGADMHLAVIKDDLTTFIHTHPQGHQENGHTRNIINEVYAHGMEEELPTGKMEEKLPTGKVEDKTIAFKVRFPETGTYKIFAQFRPQGINLQSDESITAAFWLKVEEKKPLSVSPWSFLLIVSVILIIILGWAVRKYLTVSSSIPPS